MPGSVASGRGRDAVVPRLSFEMFPPRTERAEARLRETVTALAPLCPAFCSVTYGAGGSTRERTYRSVRRIVEETDVPAAAHLTCAGASRAEIDEVARQYRALGVHHIVALRGDPPAGEARFRPRPDGYDCGASLVEGLRRIADFEISVAGYPERHPEAPSDDADIAYLRRKVDAGASRVITQVFFDNVVFLRFRDRAAAAGIEVPILPGIMPVADFAKVARFCRSCGATVPDWLARRFDGLDEQRTAMGMVGAITAADQCRELLDEGVEDFHFYTMNRPHATLATARMLGIVPTACTRDGASPASRVA